MKPTIASIPRSAKFLGLMPKYESLLPCATWYLTDLPVRWWPIRGSVLGFHQTLRILRIGLAVCKPLESFGVWRANCGRFVFAETNERRDEWLSSMSSPFGKGALAYLLPDFFLFRGTLLVVAQYFATLLSSKASASSDTVVAVYWKSAISWTCPGQPQAWYVLSLVFLCFPVGQSSLQPFF